MKIEYAFVAFTIAVLLARFLKLLRGRVLFLFVANLGLVTAVFFPENPRSAGYLLVAVVIHYLLLRFEKIPQFLLYVLPLSFLVWFKLDSTLALVGFSFLTFRMLSASIEVKARKVSGFSLPSYVTYCFFFPTLKLGPIGTLRDHLESEESPGQLNWPQLMRVLWGATKYLFLCRYFRNFMGAFGYSEWAGVDSVPELILTGFTSYVFVFLSFSGFNDIAIGLCHFLGLKMKENFRHPFTARSISDFWSNWHISLTDLIKELLFYPLNIHLLRTFGKNAKAFVTPLVLLILFLAIGVWHGLAMNFVWLGLYNAAGAIIAYFFSEGMKKVWPAYQKFLPVRYTSIALTQVFQATSFLFFDNSLEEVQRILSAVF